MEEMLSIFKVKESLRKNYGLLYLTSYKLKFVPNGATPESDFGLYDIPYSYVFKFEDEGTRGNRFYLKIQLKDNRCFKFKFDAYS